MKIDLPHADDATFKNVRNAIVAGMKPAITGDQVAPDILAAAMVAAGAMLATDMGGQCAALSLLHQIAGAVERKSRGADEEPQDARSALDDLLLDTPPAGTA